MAGFSSDWQIPCPGTPYKRKYRTSDFAWMVALGVYETKGVLLAVYACADCGWFHLTKKIDGSDVVLPGEDGTVAYRWRQDHPGERYPWDH